MTNIFIKTYGCTLNQSDSELMAGLLKQAQFNIVDNIEDAFIIIINTCTVKSPSDNKFFNYLKEIKEKYPYKKIIITGCIPQTAPEKIKKYPLVGTSQITDIVSVVEEILHENIISSLAVENNPRLNLPKIRKNPIVEIVPICAGCLGNCSYCIVKKARGRLVSYPKEEIIKQIKTALDENVKEIWLTAQDTGCYGKDINTNLIELLKEIILIKGDFKIRLGMLNPNHALEFIDELIEIYKNPKMFKFIHLPLQSGSDKILKLMKRKYTAEDFENIIKKFKQNIPDITIATDIIVGFPEENEHDFNSSVFLIRKITPDILNISKFWLRPGTEAEKLEQVKGDIIKKRSNFITDIFHNIARMQNERWLNWKGKIIIEDKKQNWIGRNYAYKQVILDGDFSLGQEFNVLIKKITPFYLMGQIIT